MTLEIHNSGNGSVTEYFVYADRRPLSSPKPSMRPQLWSDEEIQALLGNKYDSFERGRSLFNHFPAFWGLWRALNIDLKNQFTPA